MNLSLDWAQTISWIVLIFVLYSMVSERIHYAVAAFGGLLLLGFFRISEIKELFSGFASPALFTVAIVLVMSAGIVESGVFSGFGRRIAQIIHAPVRQLFTISVATSLLSAFMNNVGAIGIMLPTGKRMAVRAGWDMADFGMPLAYSSILGGSVTLIGTASNLLVSTYRFQAFGEPFRMFDFAAHGMTIVASGFFVVFFCRLCGLNVRPRQLKESAKNLKAYDDSIVDAPSVRTPRNTAIVLFSLIPVIFLASAGNLHPSVGFGFVVILWLATKVLSGSNAMKHINIPVILFLGSMLSISAVLESTGALQSAATLILPVALLFSPFFLTMAVLFVTAFFANIIDNAVAAVIMAPLAVQLYQSGQVNVNMDALLMAVAAGASLGIVLPTHQAAIVAMESTGFSRKDYIRTGLLIVLFAGVAATSVIYMVWI